MMKNWGFYIRELREQKGFTQGELARRVGISRSYLSLIEIGKFSSWREDLLRRFANALNKSFSELVQTITSDAPEKRQETPEDILDRLRIATPASIPIYPELTFHAPGPVEPLEYVYISRPISAGKKLEGYIVHGKCLEPAISDNDIVVIDRDGQIDNGDLVACLLDDGLHIGRLRKIADELYLENNQGRRKFEDCQVVAPVIEVIRRLK